MGGTIGNGSPQQDGATDDPARAKPADAIPPKFDDKEPVDGHGQPLCDTEILTPPKVGQQDQSGSKIKNIYSSTRCFVIYEAANQIRCQLPDNFGVAKVLRRRIAELGGLRASIEDWRCDPSLSPNEKMRAAREMAWALAQALEDDNTPQSDEPKDILTRVDARLRSLVKSHYRKRYCLANLVAFGSIEAFLILLILGAFISGSMGVLPTYAAYACFGALGAFLSVITGVRSIEIDINLSRWEHIFGGATRILIGVIGAVVLGLALDSRLIAPTFGNDPPIASATSGSNLDARFAVSLILAFIAGFSESLVPNLLRKGEKAVSGADKPEAPDQPIVKDMKP